MRKLLTELRAGAAADGPILIGLFAVWAIAAAVMASRGINVVSFTTYRLNLTLYLAGLFAALITALAIFLLRHRPENPISFLTAAFVSTGLASRLVRGMPMLAALVVFLPVFSKLKVAIPLFNSYTWDGTWIALDRTLHGTDPWRILQPVFGYPAVTSALSGFYHLWILLIYLGAVYFCFFQPDRVLRARFFIAYFACWTILGVLMATAFASVGPCFLEPILGDHRFDDQMAYLRHADESYRVLVLGVQERMVEAHFASESGLGRGISAMPSMHVSLAFLFFLAMRKVSRFTALFFGLFLAIILIGSVHLAYHYAVDGYAAIAGTVLIWIVAGVLARRLESVTIGVKQ